MPGTSGFIPYIVQQARNWSGATVAWGVTAGIAALFVTERLPMFRRDVYSKVPLLGARYAEYRTAEDEEEDGDAS